MKLLAILSAKKLITLSAVGVLSLATVGGVILNNRNEEPQTAQSSVKFDGEAKESPTTEIVGVEKADITEKSPAIAEVNEAEPVSDSDIIVDMSNKPTPKQKLSTDPNIQQPVSEPKNEIIWITGSLKDTPNPPCGPTKGGVMPKVVVQTHTDESWNELIKTKPGVLMMTIRDGTGQFFCSYIQESK